MAAVPESVKSTGFGLGATLLVVIAVAVLIVGFLWTKQPQQKDSGAKRPEPTSTPAGSDDDSNLGHDDYSNLRHDDYVGPKLCEDCHLKRYQQWQGNLHRKMNRLASEPGAVLGDFADRRVPYADGTLILTTEKGEFFMSFAKQDQIIRRYRVTRTIGSRYLQEYVGIAELGPEAPGDPVYSTEIRLPFGYLLRTKRWLSGQYFDSWHGPEYESDLQTSRDAFEPDKAPWRGRCAWCHNTYSFDKRLARLQGDEQIGNGIEQFYKDSVPPNPEIANSNLLPTDQLISVGISCESCHFGGREHAVEDKPIRFAPQGPNVQAIEEATPLAGTREDSRTIVSICAQCHSAPTEVYPNGAGTRNSSEALDLLSGACASRIRCTLCHDPHVPGPGTMAPVQQKHIDACLSCHPNLADAGVAREHSGHSEEVSCLDCHMPRIVQGLSAMLRTHRIASPTETSMLGKSVNACNLCHLDRSVAWTVRELARYKYNLKVEGLSETPAALLWLASEERIVRLTAAGSMGIRAEGHKFLPTLLAMLNDPVAYDRQRYLWAVEEVLGRPLSEAEFSLTGTPQWRRNQVLRLQKTLSAPTPEKSPPPL